MKQPFIYLLLLLLIASVPLQAEVVANKSGKCGFVDENGKLIIPYKYDFIGPFNESNTAVVKKGKKFGMINRAGQEVLPLKYTQVGKPKDGKVIIMKKNKFGLASVDGRLLHKPEYLHLFPFNSQGVCLAVVKKGKKAKLHDAGNTIALLRADGKEITRATAYSLSQFTGDNDINRFSKMKSDTFNTTSGYIYKASEQAYVDLEGNTVLNNRIRTDILVQLFGKGASLKKEHKNLDHTERNPFYDIIAFKYHQAIDKTNVRICAGYYNLKTKQILFRRYYDSERQWDSKKKKYTFYAKNVFVKNRSFSDGFAITTISDAGDDTGDYLLNTKGQIVLRFKEDACYDYENGYMVVEGENGLYGLMDTYQQLVVPYKYSRVKTAINQKGMWAVSDGKNWGSVDTQGKTLIPFKYDKITQWKKGDVFFVHSNGKWGAYERDKEIVKCLYDSLYSYYDNSFVYKYGDTYGMYSISNHTTSPTHDGYENCYIADTTYHDSQLRMFYLLDKDGIKTYGFLNGFGQKAIPFMFTDKDQAYSAYYYLRDKPVREYTKTDRFRLRLRLTRRTRTYKLNATIPTTEWDY